MGLLRMILGLLLGRRGGMLAGLLGGPLLGALLKMMRGGAGGGGAGGGLGGLLEKFRGAGMGDKADSWVSRGRNIELEPDEVQRALGPEELQRLSQETGIPVDELRAKLAKGLPQMVDQLTPDGQVPDDNALGGLLDKFSRYLPK